MGYKTIFSANIIGRDYLFFEDDGGLSKDLQIKSVHSENHSFREYLSQNEQIIRFVYSKAELYSIDKLTYKYVNPQINYAFLGMGLIPPFVSYTNVEGGYGILACMGKKETSRILMPGDLTI